MFDEVYRRLEELKRGQDRILRLLRLVIKEEFNMDVRIQAIIDQAVASEATEKNAVDTITAMLATLQAGVKPTMSDADVAALQTTLDQMKASAATLGVAVSSAAGAPVPAPAAV